jgi:serine protease Do
MKKFVLSIIFFTAFYASNTFANFERGYADLVDKLLPSVVSVATKKTIEKKQNPIPELPEGHPFNEMFKDFFWKSITSKKKFNRFRFWFYH